jgi:DnaJ-class molecular chaperone
MKYKDNYYILGVGTAATPEEIKKAYRKLAFKHHPDRTTGDKAAEEKFKEINEAHEVLSDPELRLVGLGMPIYGERKAFGNLFVKIDIRLPEHLREEEIELFRQLAAVRGNEEFSSTTENVK